MSDKHEQKLVPKSKDLSATDANKHEITEQELSDNVKSRRKFLKGAAAATPVLFTVANRPVWARNCSMSGQLSGNLSDQNDLPCTGEGCTQGFWQGRGYSSRLYHLDYPAHMLFSKAFGRDAFPGKSLIDVVSKNVLDKEINVPYGCSSINANQANLCENMLRELGAQAVSALQNAASPIRYDLDVQTVILSFQKSYDAGTAMALEDTKIAFDRYNNQICPL